MVKLLTKKYSDTSTIIMADIALANYDRRADFYDLEFNDTTDRTLVESLISIDTKRILEIPSGSGRNMWLADSSSTVVFADLSQAMVDHVSYKLKAANLQHSKATAVQADMTSFNLGSFDLILVPREGFQMLPKSLAADALMNLSNGLTANGLLYIDIAKLNSPQADARLPKYILEQDGSLHLDLNKQISDKYIVRHHQSIYKDGQLHVIFKYKVQHESEEEDFVSRFELEDYSVSEFDELVRSAGLKIETVYGNYDKEEYSEESSRMIFLLRRV